MTDYVSFEDISVILDPVIPAKAGIPSRRRARTAEWVPAFAGMTQK
jgi:hypothetical protein